MTETDTSATIKRMDDFLQLQMLVARFARAVDTRDSAELSTILTPDVAMELMPDTRIDSREALAGMLRDDLTWASTMHYMSNVVPHAQGNRAIIHANATAVHVSRDGVNKHFDLGARYTFTAVREDGVWLLARVQIEPVWVSGDDQNTHNAS
ncbi:nuclear transport factor 2 family protein [Streptomyces sp. NRRL F-5755]|uniref:nuclear transport factor 2 family protein n=1 Tax=Streptomyces sp. NRRL F-5755 TaxID=1519475 RepID=UPI00099C4BFA|nr:nuclear transport factor 2 family protein [Streptomyces sp. NRRL F-5755]